MKLSRYLFWLLGALLLVALFLNATAAHDWPQFNGDAQHRGRNTWETQINQSNVATLQLIFKVHLNAIVDGASVYLSGVNTASGIRNLIFVTTKDGKLMALDARTGDPIWMQQAPMGSCYVNQVRGNGPCFTTSSPAIDPNRQAIYSYGLDGYVHQYQVGNGAEIKTSDWPQLTTLKPYDEKGSSTLTVATAHNGTSYLYVTHAAYPNNPGDQGDYQGHLTTVNLTDGKQHVFNALCSDQMDVHFVALPEKPDCPEQRAGIWARAGVVYDPELDRIYATTGNGRFEPLQYHWGDSVIALNPDGTGKNGKPLDHYTPGNFAQMALNDQDLGSTTLAILPAPATSKIRHLALQGGKDGRLRLLNLEDLSREVGPVIAMPMAGEIHSQPCVWSNPGDGSTWVFVTAFQGIAAFQLTADESGSPTLTLKWHNSTGGTSPIVANDILYYARSHLLAALNPLSGAVLWQTDQIGDIHWQSPIMANGKLYIADENGDLMAFGLSQ